MIGSAKYMYASIHKLASQTMKSERKYFLSHSENVNVWSRPLLATPPTYISFTHQATNTVNHQ